MVHWLKSTGLITCLLCYGCSQSTEPLRTYSVSTDGGAEQGGVGQGGDVSQTGPFAVDGQAAMPEKVVVATGKETIDDTSNRRSRSVSAVAALPRPPRVPLPELRIPGPASASETSLTVSPTGDEPREIKLLVPEKDFPRIDGGQRLRVSFDDVDLLKVLNMDPVPPNCVDYLPDWLKSLDGQQIRLRGFMIPQTRSDGITGFQLARDTQLCCFGRNPKPYDVIPVLLKEGTTTHYIHLRPFDVVGRFAIRPYSFRGEIENLYEIEEAELIER